MAYAASYIPWYILIPRLCGSARFGFVNCWSLFQTFVLFRVNQSVVSLATFVTSFGVNIWNPNNAVSHSTNEQSWFLLTSTHLHPMLFLWGHTWPHKLESVTENRRYIRFLLNLDCGMISLLAVISQLQAIFQLFSSYPPLGRVLSSHSYAADEIILWKFGQKWDKISLKWKSRHLQG